MNQKHTTVLVTFMLVISILTILTFTGLDAYNTESTIHEGGPIEISNVEELQAMNEDLSADYVLVNDIDAWETREWNDGAGFEPIGKYIRHDSSVSFTGRLDGRNHTVTGLYINRPDTDYIGLFGSVRGGGEIQNIGVVDIDVSGNSRVGGLVGTNIWSGIVSNSYAHGNVSGEYGVGGLVGVNWDGTVSNSYATGIVSGNRYVGGLVGGNWGYGSTVSNSYATGIVSGDSSVGGLIGANIEGIVSPMVAGDLSGDSSVDGFLEFNSAGVSNSYAAGSVSGNYEVGGLVGYNEGTMSNNFYNIDSVLINDGHHITIAGLFNEQYEDWYNNGLLLDIDDYSDTLAPVDDHYEISSTDGLRDLLGFAEREGYEFRLVADIDLSNEPGLYIPYLAADFFGNNRTISNLHIDIPFAVNAGMFAYIYECKIHDVGLVDAYVNGYSYVGGLVGRNSGGTISNSYATGTVSGNDRVGGLVGSNWHGTVNKSYVTGTVSGNERVGGLVGENYGTVENSYATGTVSGDWYVGGLVGMNSFGSTVYNSYATGKVNGDWGVGGFVGQNGGTVENSHATGNVNGYERVGGLVGSNLRGTVSNSYSTGMVTRTSGSTSTDFGGFVGFNNRGKIINCYSTGSVHYEDADDPTDKGFAGSVDTFGDYEMTGNFWDMDTSGQTSNWAGGATGKTTSEMKNRDTFTGAGWDFENTWCINGDRNDGYPYLEWQQFDEVGTRDTLIILVIMVVTVVGSVAFIMLRRKRTEEHEHKDEDL